MKNINTKNSVSAQHHYLRTTVASLFGFLAVSLIIFSILAVWLNRTITDTETYVDTVAPLITKPEIQNFIADKATDTLIENAPIEEISKELLGQTALAGQSPEELKILVKPTIKKEILQVLARPAFAEFWSNTNESVHSQLITQIKSGSDTVILDFQPVIKESLVQLSGTRISFATDKIELKPDAGKLELKDSGIIKANDYYQKIQRAIVLLVVVAAISLALCIWISVHHMKTVRRVFAATGLFGLILLIMLQAPSFISVSNADTVSKEAIVAISRGIFKNLQTSLLVVTAVSFTISFGSKILEMTVLKTKKTT